MSRQTIFDKFKDIQAIGNISRVQVDTVAYLITQRCPDDILSVNGNSGSHTIVLRYLAEGVDLIVNNFDIVISEHTLNGCRKVNNSKRALELF